MKWNKYYKIFKEFSWIGIGQLLVVLGSLFGIRLLTSFLSTEQYGELALGMTVGSFIYTIFLGPISNGISRYFSLAVRKNETNNYLEAIRNIIVSISFLILILFVLGITFLVNIGYSKVLYIAISSVLFGIISSYSNIFNAIENASRHRRIVALHKGFSTWLRFLLAALFLLVFGISSSNAIIAQATAMIIILLSQSYFFMRNLENKNKNNPLNKNAQIEWKSKIYNFSWPYASWSILGWMGKSADKWGLEFFSGNRFVGFYSVLYQLGFYPMQLIIGLIITFLTPYFYDQAGDGKNKITLKKLYLLGFKIYLFVVLILMIPVIISFNYHEFIFKLFVDPKFHNFSNLLGPLMLASLIRNSTSLFSLLFQATGDNKPLVILITQSLIRILTTIIGAYKSGIHRIIFAN